jgi:hypothetical protein
MLSNGIESVTPSESMWPLFCSEVGISYEQEEQVRVFQKLTLQTKETWVDRHTAFATGRVIEAAQTATQAISLRLGQREKSTLAILSDEQKVKFLRWTSLNRERVATSTRNVPPSKTDPRYQLSSSQHLAANLYVVNHQLEDIVKTIPRAAPLVTGLSLKKLSQRPCFESLGCREINQERKLSRDASFASSGSLKRSASEMSMEEADRPHIPQLLPTDAQAAAQGTLDTAIGHIKEIIPKPPTPSVIRSVPILPAPTRVSSMARDRHNSQPSTYESNSYPKFASGLATAHASAPVLNSRGEEVLVKRPAHFFLPAHLNVVPEEMWPGVDAEDFLLNLTDEDWAIGEGIDMDA